MMRFSAIRLGAYDFLPKPVSLFEIANVLDRIGEKKALENKTIALESRLQRVEGVRPDRHPADAAAENSSKRLRPPIRR